MRSPLLARLLGSPAPDTTARAPGLAFIAPPRADLPANPNWRMAMAMNDILRAAALVDDYDSAKVVAAYLNADCLMQEATARDPSGWTAERVLAVGRLLAEAFRDGRIQAAPASTARAPLPRVDVIDSLSAKHASTIGLDAVGASLNGGDHVERV